MRPKKDNRTGLFMYPPGEEMPDPEFFPKIRIIVDSEQSKEQLLRAIEYIHYLGCIDSDYIAVNCLMHHYLYPDSIEVNPEQNFDYGEMR